MKTGSDPRPWVIRYRGGMWQVLRHVPRARGVSDACWVVDGARYEPFLRAGSVASAYRLVCAMLEVAEVYSGVGDEGR